MSNHRFPKSVRLLQAREFDRVFAARKRASDLWIVLHGASNELGYARLGLTVSRAVGNAVVRNRWKRLLREAFRATHSALPALDLVCSPRASAIPELKQLETSLQSLSERLNQRADQPPQSRGRASS